MICERLGTQLSLAQIIEAATWKGGREIAKGQRQGGGREFYTCQGLWLTLL